MNAVHWGVRGALVRRLLILASGLVATATFGGAAAGPAEKWPGTSAVKQQLSQEASERSDSLNRFFVGGSVSGASGRFLGDRMDLSLLDLGVSMSYLRRLDPESVVSVGVLFDYSRMGVLFRPETVTALSVLPTVVVGLHDTWIRPFVGVAAGPMWLSVEGDARAEEGVGRGLALAVFGRWGVQFRILRRFVLVLEPVTLGWISHGGTLKTSRVGFEFSF